LNTTYTCDRYQQTNDSASDDFNIQTMCFKFLNLSVPENGREKKTTKHIPPKMQNGIYFSGVEVLETVEGLKCWKE
ncbi:hypothetical protein T12_15084, partial [Trichinella patagoniensis]